MSIDFIPKNDRSFLTWLINLISYIFNGGALRFGVPNEEFDRLKNGTDDFEQKLNVADDPSTRTKAAIQAKKDSRMVVEKVARLFVKRFLNNNPLVTNADRDNMGLPIYKESRSPAPTPTVKPDFSIEPSGGSRLEIHFHAHDADREQRNAKPAGVHGVEIAWAILDEAPKSYADLVHSAFDTRSPYIFQFDLADAGKRAWFCLRWENTRGEKGPWSEIQSAIIP
jgi:hypothetical protein